MADITSLIIHLRALGNKETEPVNKGRGLCNEIDHEFPIWNSTTSSYENAHIHRAFEGTLDKWTESKGLHSTCPIEGCFKSYSANSYKWSGTAENNRRLQMCLDLADMLEKDMLDDQG